MLPFTAPTCRLARFFCAGLAGFCLPQPASAQLAVHYFEKPPYYFTQHGKAAGFLNERTRHILDSAGIDAEFTEIPPKRILVYLQQNLQPLCSPGWYKTVEREQFARFSLPIHQDPPPVILARPAVAGQIRALGSLRALFATPELRLLLADGLSYGSTLDSLILHMPNPPQRHTVRELQLAQMLQAGRGDYMLFDRIGLNEAATRREIRKFDLVRIDFPDLPAGEKRYLMCSRQVTPETLEKIDHAIRKLPGMPKQSFHP